jgi:GAF domain-containing protein
MSQMQRVTILYDASQAVLSTFEADEVLQRILTIAQDYFHLRTVAILLLDDDMRELYVRSHIGWSEDAQGLRVPVGEGLIGTAAKIKRPVYAPNVTKDARYVCTVPGTVSELAIPLMVRDSVVGVLDCQSDNLNHFDKETMDLLTLFSTQASMALQNARLYKQVSRAKKDVPRCLTVTQRRHFPYLLSRRRGASRWRSGLTTPPHGNNGSSTSTPAGTPCFPMIDRNCGRAGIWCGGLAAC